MKKMLKPTIITVIVIGAFLPWIRDRLGDFSMMVYPTGWEGGVILWYILIAITTSLFLRKIFDMK